MYMGIEQFEAFDAQRAAALRDYYAFARDNDLFLTYVIINPQADRSKGLTEQGEHVAARICDRDSSGITVKGAKMLGTSAIMANEVLSPQFSREAREEHTRCPSRYRSTPKLKILSKMYELAAGRPDNRHPAASMKTTPCCTDEVHVPWAGVHCRRCRHVPGAIPRHSGACLPEPSMSDPLDGEAPFLLLTRRMTPPRWEPIIAPGSKR
jgi:4-hydroxyphenylacetate 3-monooxygenase